MTKGDFARLRAWAGEEGHQLNVTQPGATSDATWRVAVDLEDPVTLHATASARDIDEAASGVIEQLETIGEVIA
jgi:hypothetical protein